MSKENVYVVVGCTWPFSGSVHTSKRGAHKAAANIRRKIRAKYPRLTRCATANCGVMVEPRTRRDMSPFWKIHTP